MPIRTSRRYNAPRLAVAAMRMGAQTISVGAAITQAEQYPTATIKLATNPTDSGIESTDEVFSNGFN